MAVTFYPNYIHNVGFNAAEEPSVTTQNYACSGGETSGAAYDWIGLSGTDRIVSSNQYYGLIEDYGELSHAINIVESKAVTGSLSLRCINKWKTGTLSELLSPQLFR